MEDNQIADSVGLGWRTELAAGIMLHLDEIDVVEVIADEFFDASAKNIRALNTLSKQIPVMLHGISLGMASTIPVAERRLAQCARLLEKVEHFLWSEHLAFVRAGDVEIGHLAFPPRNDDTAYGTAENLHLAKKIVGVQPVLENVSTLIDPPGSTCSEADWIGKVLSLTQGKLLLDLHNIYTNGFNLGYDPFALIDSLPVDGFPVIHISGGRMLSELVDGEKHERILDDHLHDVPDPVYDLLEYAALKSETPLTVILERDGCYPSTTELLLQLRRARIAMKRGRARKNNQVIDERAAV